MYIYFVGYFIETSNYSKGAKVEAHIIAVVYTLRGDSYRIISARKASKGERKRYEENCQA